MHDNWMDRSTNIRAGEELPVPVLEKYLLDHLPNAESPLVVEQFPGGASNLTYLLRLGQQELVLRRPPFGSKVKSAHDMGREYKVLSALSQSYRKAPRPLVHCEDEAVIGAPFYVMERVQGVILRSAKGPAAELPAETIRAIAESLMTTLVELHALDYVDAGLGDLGKPQGYTERQVTGWTKRYFKAKTDEWSDLEKVAAWLNNNIPAETGAALIHNDYKHDNVVLDAKDLTKIKAILDWEMCTIGDPLMDLGSAMAYWPNQDDPPLLQFVGKSPAHLPGNPSRGEMLEMYAQKSGRDPGNFVFYYAYGLFKLAGIIQQIYYRYRMGHTKDPRFAQMHLSVKALGKMALRAVEKGQVDDLS